jgi:hypothetical protein
MNSYLNTHPWLKGLLVVVESALFGAVIDAPTSGFDYSRAGLRHALTIAITAVLCAARNYLRTSPLDVKLNPQLDPLTSIDLSGSPPQS